MKKIRKNTETKEFTAEKMLSLCGICNEARATERCIDCDGKGKNICDSCAGNNHYGQFHEND